MGLPRVDEHLPEPQLLLVQFRVLLEVVLVREADRDQLPLDAENRDLEVLLELLVLPVGIWRKLVVEWNREDNRGIGLQEVDQELI